LRNINKEEIIKNLKESIEELDRDKFYTEGTFSEDNLAQYKNFLQSLQDPEWISVKDELPKLGTVVFIYGTYDGYDKVYSDHMSLGICYEDGYWHDILDPFGACSGDTHVEFWMPIRFPEGPRKC
jgi:hypothetical protein